MSEAEAGAEAEAEAEGAWWGRRVAPALAQGCAGDRWREERGEAALEAGGVLRVDPRGFFLVWRAPDRNAEVVDLCSVSDVYFGGLPKDPKLVGQLARHGEDVAEKTLTVVMGADFVNLTHHNYVFPSVELAQVWLEGLRKITHNHKMGHLSVQTNLLKQWTFVRLSVNARGKVPLQLVVELLAQAPARSERPSDAGLRSERQETLSQALADAGLDRSQVKSVEPEALTFEIFEALYRAACPRPDIDDLYTKICGDDAATAAGAGLSAEKFRAFLNERQRDQRLNEILRPLYSAKHTADLIRALEPSASARANGRMTREGFFRYLTSDEATPVALDRLDVYMDMTQPLTHYFINSSHNTYLVGRQFAGSSSVEMYRQVLLSGCRCVELDTWDGSNGEPIVTHGHAVCSDILLRDVLYAIADTAFVASEWPVVLSIENHCTRPQQQRMAQLMEEALGPLLLREPLPDFPLKAGVELPSPWALRRKVLVKNKRLKPDEERAQLELFRQGQLVIEDDDDDQDDPQVPGECAALGNADCPKSGFEGDEGVRPASPVALPPCDALRATPSGPEEPPRPQEQDGAEEGGVAARPPTALSLQLSSSSSSSAAPSGAKGSFAATPEEDDAPLPYVHVTSTSKVHPWLSSLVNYVEPVKFPGFTAAQQRDVHYHMSSFAETNGQSLVNKFGRELINYNKRQMTRIYPKGVRVDSSNFIPQIFWNGGCQMVSLNFQTPDLPMQLNQGKFEHNGNAGYLLKPDIMRRADRDFDPSTEAPVDGVIAGQCSVQVISGQFLCERPATTYVEVDMYGLPIDTIRREFRTRAVPNNGLNPVYNEEPFLFRLVVLPDLALLRVSAVEEGGRLLGQRVLPLDGLQPGYRHIPLRSDANQPLPLAQLFCYIEIKIYVPAGYEDLTAALLDPRGHRLAREAAAAAAAAGGGEGAEAEAGDARLKKGEEPWPFVSVEMAPLRALPAFRRLAQRHCAEVRSLRARHHKQLLREGRRQSEEIEKMAARKDPLSLVADSEIRPLVRAQAGAWSELRARHVRAEWELVKRQLAAQEALLLRLQEEAHHRQRKELKRMHDRQKRELTAQQAKASVEAMRALAQEEEEMPAACGSGAALNGASGEAGGAGGGGAGGGSGGGGGGGAFGRHSRTDRKRRMRERMRSNTNLFLREMRMLMARQDKTMERLTAQHAQARDALFKEMQRIYELYNNEELEYSLQPKIENYV